MHLKFLHIIIPFLASLLFISCGSKEKAFLPEDKMQDILLQLHLADVIAEAQGNSLPWRRASRQEHYDEILDIFEVSREDFFRSYDHYIKEPEVMDSIYVRLIKDVEARMEVIREKNYDGQKDKKKWIKEEKSTPSTKKKDSKEIKASVKKSSVGGRGN